MKRGLFCFRQDLRLHDHPALLNALAENDQLDLVYLFEDRVWCSQTPGRMASHRAQFILESLQSLKKNIEKKGGALLFARGTATEVLPRLMQKLGADCCYMQAHSAHEEKGEEYKLGRLVNLKLVEGSTLIHPDDFSTPVKSFPETFTKFRKLVEKECKPRTPLPPPPLLRCSVKYSDTLPKITQFSLKKTVWDHRCPFHFEGGEDAAKQRIISWMWKDDWLRKYKKTRNGLLGSLFSSRFSPWLAQGCLSPRLIYEQIKEYESEREANESTYWLIFELLWRDFFHFLARIHGPLIFLERGLHPERPPRPQNLDHKNLFDFWKKGRTKDTFVNANMNELRLTGWMSNRGRQNVASYLIHELGLDWRLGAQWFEAQLTDYDPCSNYGNWLYLSGYGSDPQPNRVFNLSKQAEIYDPKFAYRKLWTEDRSN